MFSIWTLFKEIEEKRTLNIYIELLSVYTMQYRMY